MFHGYYSDRTFSVDIILTENFESKISAHTLLTENFLWICLLYNIFREYYSDRKFSVDISFTENFLWIIFSQKIFCGYHYGRI